MIHRLLFSTMLCVLFSGIVSAQTDSTKRWTKQYRDGYIKGCVSTAKVKLGEDSALLYCNCIAGKLEAMYPDSKEVTKLTREDFLKPELKQMILRCMNKTWTDADRTNFLSNCEKAAAPGIGDEKAKTYCACMQQKIEARFATAAEADTLTKEDMAKPEWQAIIKACLQ